MDSPLKIGVIGCGSISSTYFKNLMNIEELSIIACADIDIEKARMIGNQFQISKSSNVEELLSNKEIDLVVNLTVPKAHYEISKEIIKSKKHLYSEKPLAIDRKEGNELIDFAKEQGVSIGCAPDTFLGIGIQTGIKLINKNMIGTPIAGSISMFTAGHERWHPNPGFFYLKGGGPVFDMGPYYLTTLIAILGPVKRVSSLSKRTYDHRTSALNKDMQLPVEIDTHISGILEFQNGAIVSLTMSFDVWGSEMPKVEIYGTKGTISLPDPNQFDGAIKVKIGTSNWKKNKLVSTGPGRGIGIIEMATAIRENRLSRVDASLANHVLDVMQTLAESSNSGDCIDINSSCEKPKPVEYNY